MSDDEQYYDLIARLRKRNTVLAAALNDTLGPVAAWAGAYASTHDLPDLHPQHQKLIERIKVLTAQSTE